MALSVKAKRVLEVALGDKSMGEEIAAAIDDASAGVVPAGSISEAELATAVATKLNNGDSTATALDAVSGIVKCDGAGTLAAAAAGTDYLAPAGDGSSLSGVVHAEADPIVGAVSGIVKADGAGAISAAVAGTDFVAPLPVGTSNLASAAPDQAAMVAAFGAAADHDGEFASYLDSSDATNTYACFSDGVAWWYVKGTIGA